MKNDQAEKLRAHLRNQQPVSLNEGRVISVISGKGGVGKSNISLNLSLLLKMRQQKVLLIDMDIGMGNQDILIGRSFPFTLASYFQGEVPLNGVIEKGPMDIAMISGGSGLADMLQLDKVKISNFLNDLSAILSQYDFIILDMGAGMTKEAVSFISASKEVIVVTTPEPPAIMDAYAAIKHIVRDQKDIKLSMIMNRAEDLQQANEAFQRIEAVIKQFLQMEITYLGSMFEDKLVRLAVQRQIPFVLLDGKGQVSQQLAIIAAHFLHDIQTIEQGKSHAFIQRLKHLLLGRR